jgi:hypothetical protein
MEPSPGADGCQGFQLQGSPCQEQPNLTIMGELPAEPPQLGGKIMPRKLLPALVFALGLFSAAAAAADGDIYVGGPWGTNIQRLPYTITAPGAYYLSGNLTYSGTGDGITIAVGLKHVTLDLMGFTLNGSGTGRYGVSLDNNKNVEIRNGTVTGWSTGIHEGYTGGGTLQRILNVRVIGNSAGIAFNGSGHLVKGCEATATGDNCAIYVPQSGMVSGCTVKFAEGVGIWISGGIAIDNVVTGTGTGGSRAGIEVTSDGGLIKDNKVSGCAYGIWGSSGLNAIGNTVNAASGTTGFLLVTDDYSTLLDQNTVTGDGLHYTATTKVYKRSNF